MTEMISKHQAETAIELAFQFEGKLEMYDELAKFNEDVTRSGTHRAMIEIAAVVNEIEDKLPEGAMDLLGYDVFYGHVIHEFDFSQLPIPQLKDTVENVTASIIAEFELNQPGAAPGM